MKYILKLENSEVWLSKSKKFHELTTINNRVSDHPDFLFAYMCKYFLQECYTVYAVL